MKRCSTRPAGSGDLPGSFRCWLRGKLPLNRSSVRPCSRAALLSVVLIAWLTAPVAAVRAQDPFGADPFAPAGPGADDPFGMPAADAPAAPAAEAEAPATTPAEDPDPVVRSVRASDPQTAEQLTRAIQIMLNLGRIDEARRYLDALLALQLDAAQLARLERQFGTPLFIRIQRTKELAPEGVELGRSVMQAAAAAARDPERLRRLVRDLGDDERAVRYAALVDLRSAGVDAVPPILQAMADPERAAAHRYLRAALAALGDPIVDALNVSLRSSDADLVAQVAEVLGVIGARRSATYLLRPALAAESEPAVRQAARVALQRILGVAPTGGEAIRYLDERARRLYQETRLRDVDEEGNVTVWAWDVEAGRPERHVLSADDAAVARAAELAADLEAIAPEDRAARLLRLATHLELAKITSGLDRPLPREEGVAFALAVAAGPELLEAVMNYAMQEGHPIAATAAAEVLGEIGTLHLLQSADGRPRPLAAALTHPDRRLRLAAAEAILKLDPRTPFAGSSQLPEVLGYALRSVGERRVLVGYPRNEGAQTLIGMLRELGFEADWAATGREVLLKSLESPDYEFVLVSDAVDRPPISELMQAFRQDARSADLPLGLMARKAEYDRVRRLAARDELAIALPQPARLEELSDAAGRLLSVAGRGLVSREQRLEQARQALQWLERLAQREESYPFYDLVRQQPAVVRALDVPELVEQAASVLGWFGTPTAQQALVELASQYNRPLSERRAAVRALATAVERRGLMLTRDEILRQYERYNQSATLDRETQQLLGRVLDVIEAPSQAAKAEGESEVDTERAAG